MKLWQDDWLPLWAVLVQLAASEALTDPTRVQHFIRPAQEPVPVVPPSPAGPPLLLLPLPSPPHAEEQLWPSHVNTGPSQAMQLPVSHATSCWVHIVWMQVTQAAG